ncbi:MAG: SurA N-terminal domain-containing protein [Acidobacteriota bacterium]
MALKWLRDQIKYLAWILWIIAAAFVITLLYDPGAGNQVPGNQVAATVGSQQITYGEFQRQYRNLEDNYRQMFGEQWSNDMAKQLNLAKQALDQLINRRILLLEAERVGLTATDKEVQNAIVDYPAFKDENGKFVGRETVQRVLAANRFTGEEFSELMRQDVLLEKLRTVIGDTLFVGDAELEAAYRDQNEKASIRYVKVPSSQFATEVEVTQEELQAYFDENATDYEVGEQRIVDYLLVDSVKMRREIEIPDEELQQYWQENQGDFEREEQVRARHILLRVTPDRDEAAAEADLLAIRTRIEGGEDFAVVARETSDDEGSAQRGGSLGFFGRGDMVEAFDKAAFDAEPGTLVGPVKTDFGFHLIDVQEHREGGVQPFEEAKPVIRSRMLGERVDQLAADKIQDVSRRITEESLTEAAQLETLATEEAITFQTTQPFSKGDAVVGIGRAADFSDSAFSLEEGGVSSPVKVPRGWVILRLAEIKAPHVPELAAVEAQVRTAVSADKQKVIAVERLRDARAAAGTEGEATVLDSIASTMGVEVQESGEFGRLGTISGLGRLRDVMDAALSMEAGDLSEAYSTEDGAVIFEVQNRTTFDAAQFDEDKSATREQETNKRLEQLLASLIEERRRDLAPKYDAQVVQDFGLQTEST